MKKCSKCGVEFPATSEYYNTRKDSADGYRNDCKKCKSERCKQYSELNKGAIVEQRKRYYQENKEEIKDRVSNYYQLNKESRAKYASQYRQENRESISARDALYYRENKEAIIEWNKRYNQDHKDERMEYSKKYREINMACLLEKKRLYYHKNKEHCSSRMKAYYKSNKVKLAICSKQYRKEHIEDRNVSNQRRKAKIRGLPHTLTLKQWTDAKACFSNKCAFCGKDKPLTQEHFLAVKHKGGYTKDNIIPSCQSCNSSKWAHSCLDWYPKQPFYSKEREKAILAYLGYKNGIQQLALL